MKQKEKITTCRFRNLFANTVIQEGNLKGWGVSFFYCANSYVNLCKFSANYVQMAQCTVTTIYIWRNIYL